MYAKKRNKQASFLIFFYLDGVIIAELGLKWTNLASQANFMKKFDISNPDSKKS